MLTFSEVCFSIITVAYFALPFTSGYMLWTFCHPATLVQDKGENVEVEVEEVRTG